MVSNWCACNKMSTNPNKTKCIVISNADNSTTKSTSININNIVLGQVHFKYMKDMHLGLQINNVCRKPYSKQRYLMRITDCHRSYKTKKKIHNLYI